MNHVTINESHQHSDHLIVTEGNSQFRAFNSIIKSANGSTALWYSENYQGKMHLENSVVEVAKINHQSNNSSQFSDNNVVYGVSNITSLGQLNSNSPAIGLGVASILDSANSILSSPLIDLDGNQRPLPAGSNPDAGAFEDSLAIGDFNILLSQCGYLLEATVLNSNAYSVEWIYNNDTVSTDASFTANGLGTYTVYVTSTDRNAVLSETISLTDPLRFVTSLVKNNCTDVGGSNNGRIEWTNVQGGNPVYMGSNYHVFLTDGFGNMNFGSWNATPNSNHVFSESGLGSGQYIINVENGSGCTVRDTVEIVDQDGGLYYVSIQGDNSNDGSTASLAFETIEYALTQVCDQDTIILLDGIYYEDSLHVTTELVIASEYLLDLDTSHISNTIIDGDNDGWIMAWEAGSSSWSDTTSNQLVGLTIRNGNSTNSSYAGGLSVWNSRPLTINHVRFRNNQNT